MHPWVTKHWCEQLGGVADDLNNECLFFIPDMHAITVPQNPEELRERTV